MLQFARVILWLCISFVCEALLIGAPLQLSFPKEEDSIETIDARISGISAFEDFVMLYSLERPYIIKTPFKESGKSREEKFGTFSESQRIEFKRAPQDASWQGVIAKEESFLIFDGYNLGFSGLGRSDLSDYGYKSFAWDLIKPPRDKGGEAPQWELERYRADFKKATLKTAGLRYSGIAPVPKSWIKGSKDYYFLASRIPGYPLQILSCSQSEISDCIVERGCFVEKTRGMAPEGITGIGIREKDRLIVVADSVNNKLHKLKFDSCFHTYKVGEINLPPEIKKISGVSVDDKGRLWVTSLLKDDYLNASVYLWKEW